ncbi:MAG: methylmalonyl-CoA mutase small subunit, partial [Alistipes sp.]|nr:methylmalonyl-CoA mutase small subunit [Alistipes sp.]
MANTNHEKLFTEFPPVPTAQWEEVITADLKGADYERKLVWRTGEGFNVRPYYRAENLEGLRFLGSQAGEFPYVRGTRGHNRWRIHQTVTVADPAAANAEALKLLGSGVDSLGFHIAKADFTAADLDVLLREIRLSAIDLVFCGEKMGHVADLVLAKIEKESLAKEDAHIAFA